jgi:hypothetical protein
MESQANQPPILAPGTLLARTRRQCSDLD